MLRVLRTKGLPEKVLFAGRVENEVHCALTELQIPAMAAYQNSMRKNFSLPAGAWTLRPCSILIFGLHSLQLFNKRIR